MDLEKVYQLTILEYANRKDLKREILDATDIERGHNPSCGDDITILVKVENNIVKDISYIGLGCAISQASTAMLIELIQGKSVSESKEIIDIFFKMIKDTSITEEEKDRLNDASILEFTKDMPARIKCSTLSWHSTKVVLDKYN